MAVRIYKPGRNYKARRVVLIYCGIHASNLDDAICRDADVADGRCIAGAVDNCGVPNR